MRPTGADEERAGVLMRARSSSATDLLHAPRADLSVSRRAYRSPSSVGDGRHLRWLGAIRLHCPLTPGTTAIMQLQLLTQGTIAGGVSVKLVCDMLLSAISV